MRRAIVALALFASPALAQVDPWTLGSDKILHLSGSTTITISFENGPVNPAGFPSHMFVLRNSATGQEALGLSLAQVERTGEQWASPAQ